MDTLRKFLLLVTSVLILNGVLIALVIGIGYALPPSPLLAFNVEANQNQNRAYVYMVDVLRRQAVQISDRGSLYADPAWSTDGQLAFGSLDLQNGRWHIEVRNSSQQHIITDSLSRYIGLSWLHDGRLAFFEHRLEPDYQRFILSWDGQGLIKVGIPFEFASNPSWSRDGQLAFTYLQPNYNGVGVWDGNDFQSVSLPELPNNFLPLLSPDLQIAFLPIMDATGTTDIFVWDGELTRNITQKPGVYQHLAWSYNRQLAFSFAENNTTGIYIWDGDRIRRIIDNVSGGSFPSWSPDGRLAFLSQNGQHWEVYVWDGQIVTNITSYPVQRATLSWSDNGWLAFASDVEGASGIYVWDGKNTFQVSDTTGLHGQPQWWPLPN